MNEITLTVANDLKSDLSLGARAPNSKKISLKARNAQTLRPEFEKNWWINNFIVSLKAQNMIIYYSLNNETFILNESFFRYHSYKTTPGQSNFQLIGTSWFFLIMCLDANKNHIFVKRFINHNKMTQTLKVNVQDTIINFKETILDYKISWTTGLVLFYASKIDIFQINRDYNDGSI